MALRMAPLLVLCSLFTVQCASLGVKVKMSKPKQQCDLAVYVNNRIEAMVVVNDTLISTEPDADYCRVSMYFEMREFIREWNKMDPNNIDSSRLPPLFYFVINSNKQVVIPYFQHYSTWTADRHIGIPDSVTRVHDTDSLPQFPGQRPYKTRQLEVDVDFRPRALLYFGKPKTEGDERESWPDISMTIYLNEFIREFNSEQSRLPRLFTFTTYNDVYIVKCFQQTECKVIQTVGFAAGISGTLIKTPDLVKLSNGRR